MPDTKPKICPESEHQWDGTAKWISNRDLSSVSCSKCGIGFMGPEIYLQIFDRNYKAAKDARN
jgi:hypothetical protein